MPMAKTKCLWLFPFYFCCHTTQEMVGGKRTIVTPPCRALFGASLASTLYPDKWRYWWHMAKDQEGPNGCASVLWYEIDPCLLKER